MIDEFPEAMIWATIVLAGITVIRIYWYWWESKHER